MPPTDPTLRAWWPTTQSLDLIEAPIDETARAVTTELTRVLKGEQLIHGWREARSFDEALRHAPQFDNVPTYFVLLPTHSKWTVMWNNSFLCDGYASLCWCVTAHHGLTTLHWSSHDDWTTFQSGSIFHLHRRDGDEMVERRVQTAQTDKRWDFFQNGVPLPEEDLAGYQARKKRDRLDEARTLSLLARLGADPWRESFYALPGKIYAIERLSRPSLVRTKSRDEVLRPTP